MRIGLTVLVAGALTACASQPPQVQYTPVEAQTQPSTSQPATLPAEQGPFQPDRYLFACNLNFSNRPATDSQNRILDYSPIINVKGILLAASPTNGACMTSGFGWRGSRMHKGVDLQSRPASTIYSAGPGIIREISWQTGFGNQVLIDHGQGVFTRYGHLAYFAEELRPGDRIGFGIPLGLMGDTGNATAIHLHYEILTGNYHTPKKSWGLAANNPLDFPGWDGLNAMGQP